MIQVDPGDIFITSDGRVVECWYIQETFYGPMVIDVNNDAHRMEEIKELYAKATVVER